MRKIKKYYFLFLWLPGSLLYGQNTDAVKKYIDTYKELAIQEMIRTGVPASITLAQGIHESGAGNSKLALASNNHFGIKCKSNWTGETVKHDDDAKGECFRKYALPEDSYKDHSDFLKNSPRYSSLFTLSPDDYTGWANGLKKAGYATNPKYPDVLVKLIEDYGLQQYSLAAIARMSNYQPSSDTVKQIDERPFIPGREGETISTLVQHTYPEDVFRINETKVVFIKKGTSFLGIAKKYEIDLSRIFDFNDMEIAEQSDKDQLIYLQRKRKTGNNEFHIVQAGETLHDIAQAEAIRLESLLQLNYLNRDDKPAIGEKLSLKTKASKMPALAVRGNYSLLPGQLPK